MSDASASFRRPPTAQGAVLNELRRSILRGQLKPGTHIRQDAVAKEFGVSRVPVREALKTLEAEGQVLYEPHHGYRVVELDVAEVRELYRMRQLLEDEAIRVAMTKIDDEDIAAMREMIEKMEAIPQDEVERMAALNRQFHFSLFDIAGMPRLRNYIRMLWDASDAYRAVYYSNERTRERVHAEHRELVEAAAARDTERLIEVFSEHRGNLLEFMDDVLIESEATAPGDR